MEVGQMNDDKKIAEWVVQTCLLFGTTAQTAYTVAGLFLEGLQSEASKKGTP